jgi:NDP-sugar pyrophosphorylase family protein
MNPNRLVVVVLAAGEGIRMKPVSSLPKPLIPLREKNLLGWSLASLRPLVSGGLLTIDDIYIATTRKIKEYINDSKVEIYGKFSNENIFEVNDSKSPLETLNRTVELLIKSDRVDTTSSMLVIDADHYFRLSSTHINNLLCNFAPKTVAIWTTYKNPDDLSWCFSIKTSPNEKKLVEKPSIEQSKEIDTSKGVIGAYFFGNIDFIAHFLHEKSECQLCIDNRLDQGYISSLINHLLKSGWSLEENQVGEFIPMGNPDQYSLAAQKVHSEIGIYDEPTIFLDFDGTVVTHDATGDKFDETVLQNRIESIKQMQKNGAKIVLTTARSEKHRKSIEQFLENTGLKVHAVVFGINGGLRFIVNDTKPFITGIETALAINVVRNANSEIPMVSDWNLFPSLQKICDLSGESGAKTELLMKNGEYFVRKSSYSIEMSRKLHYQVRWHNFVNELNLKDVLTLEIFNQSFTHFPNSLSYYDSNYIYGACSVYEAAKQKKLVSPLPFVLSSLNSLHKVTKSKIKGSKLSFALLWKMKVMPVVSQHVAQVQKLEQENIEDFLDKLKKLSIELESRQNDSFFQLTGLRSLVHGDPTYENLGYFDEKIVFFDPIGTMIDPSFDVESLNLGRTYPIFDYSRVFLSECLDYEQWTLPDINKLSPYDLQSKFIEFRKSLEDSCDKDFSYENLEIIVLSDLLRIFKYKINMRERQLCLLYANDVLDIILESVY